MIRTEQYPKELFLLIVEFAKKKAEILHIDLIESIKTYTPIYYLIGNNSWEFREDSTYWEEFLQRYNSGEDLVELLYDMYIKNRKQFSDHQWFGCFRYSYKEDQNGDGVIKIHFLNNRSSKEGPLSSSQKGSRLEELREMFQDIKKNYPQAEYVQGGSWLYNLESYKRLFPEEYIDNLKSTKPQTDLLTIWGQFVNSEWEIKEDLAKEFLEKLRDVTSEEELSTIFKYPELFPKSEIKYFYKHYNIS